MARMIDPTIAIGHTHVVTLPVDRFHVEPGFNIRIDRPELTDHIRWLADRIKDTGYDTSKPIVVRWTDDRAVIVDGHCRFAAVNLAIQEGRNIRGIPAVAEPKGLQDAERHLMTITANGGLAPTPFEAAHGVRNALADGWTEDQIAKFCGRSRSWVDGLLILNGAPEPVRQAVVTGEISATVATKLARKGASAAIEGLQAAREHLAPGKTRITDKAVAAAGEAASARVTGPHMNAEQRVLDRCLPILAHWMARTTVKGLVTDEVREVMERLRALLPGGEDE